MKRFIKVVSVEMTDQLEAKGFKYMTEYLNNKEIYVFVETDALRKELSDRKSYSKKYWFVDNVLKF